MDTGRILSVLDQLIAQAPNADRDDKSTMVTIVIELENSLLDHLLDPEMDNVKSKINILKRLIS